MTLPDDFVAGLFWGVILGIALMGLLLWGLDGIAQRRWIKRDAPVVRLRGGHSPPARNPGPPGLVPKTPPQAPPPQVPLQRYRSR